MKQLADIIKERNLSIEIEIDGGVDEETIIPCVEAGATILVAGSAIYGKENRAEALQRIKAAGERAFKNEICYRLCRRTGNRDC